MSVITDLADFINGATYNSLPHETIQNVKLHLLDTIAATFAGSKTPDGEAIEEFLRNTEVQGDIPVLGFRIKAALFPSIIASCATARCSELDDIHLESCTTPGSITIPTAIALANAGYFTNPKDFLVAIAIGYEFLIRIGMAADGPIVLRKGIWPTYLGATLCGAVIAAKALNLNATQTASAIATALATSTGTASRTRGIRSSRWLTVGLAAQNGVIASFLAKDGFVGDDTLIDRTSGKIYGIKLSIAQLTNELGKQFYIDDTGMKPYPIARQALAALEAYKEIMYTNSINPELIQEIIIRVPKQVIFVIDHPKLPESHLEAISSIQYQIALASFVPQGYIATDNERIEINSNMYNLINKIQIRPSRELEHYYPSIWSAKVEVRINRHRYSCKMLYPKGDPRNRLNWQELTSKFYRIAQPIIGKAQSEQLVNSVQNLDASKSMTQFLLSCML